MLKQLSRLKHTSRIIVLGFVLLMGVSLIFFYAPRNTNRAEPSRSTALVAKVGGDEITAAAPASPSWAVTSVLLTAWFVIA